MTEAERRIQRAAERSILSATGARDENAARAAFGCEECGGDFIGSIFIRYFARGAGFMAGVICVAVVLVLALKRWALS